MPSLLDLRRELGLCRRWMRHDLKAVDPATDPVAWCLDRESALGRRFIEVVGREETPQHMGWLPRARLLDVLRPFSPADADALERAPGTDVGRWSVLYLADAVSVATETLTDLAELVAAPMPGGCAASYATCIGGVEHVWDAEVVFEEEEEPDAQDGGESACSRCGVMEMSWMRMHTDW